MLSLQVFVKVKLCPYKMSWEHLRTVWPGFLEFWQKFIDMEFWIQIVKLDAHAMNDPVLIKIIQCCIKFLLFSINDKEIFHSFLSCWIEKTLFILIWNKKKNYQIKTDFFPFLQSCQPFANSMFSFSWK